ncbi:DUF1559 domain-containing protein [bacterium]|nr:MAG: DUF1559 domain-containing protein [bacterium]
MRRFDISWQQRSGFTLIEMVVALAVLVILAALLYPFMARARANAQRSTCQSNLKQMGLGVLQYARDYDESYPPAVTGAPDVVPNARYQPPKGWADAIQPYLKTTAIYECPNETQSANKDPLQVGYSDYWYNCALSWNGKQGAKARWNAQVPMQDFIKVSRTIMFGDGNAGSARSRSNGTTSATNKILSSPNAWAPKNGKVSGSGFASGGVRHLNGLNLCFADGHVKWFASSGPNSSVAIYNSNTPFSVSGDSPTFNATKE